MLIVDCGSYVSVAVKVIVDKGIGMGVIEGINENQLGIYGD